MSLDVYLKQPSAPHSVEARIFVREDGGNKEITREEWDRRFPGRELFTVTSDGDDEVYSANITHNLSTMAEAAGIYKALWRPEEIGITTAEQLISPLREGLDRLRGDPTHFRQFSPSNGWGTYEGLVRFVEDYLAACEEYPTAEVHVSR